MSFILDALKKSETDRQQQTPAAFATVPSSDGSPRAPRWLMLLGALLAINLIVLLGLLLRPGDDTPADTVTAAAVEKTSSAATADFATQIEAARLNESQRRAPPPSAEGQQPPASAIPVATDAGVDVSATIPVSNMPAQQVASLPTIYELRANGSITLPELHLDIHVYSEIPEDRFVFINMSKQREKSQLTEGPTVNEITPDGVVLDYRGTTFLLPRD